MRDIRLQHLTTKVLPESITLLKDWVFAGTTLPLRLFKIKSVILNGADRLAMPDWIKTALPALIGVFGTGITLVLGYRQWKRQQKTTREESFNNDRKAAYKALWGLVESFNVELRTSGRARAREGKIAELNAFLLKNGLYIQPEHCSLAKRYAAALSRLDSLIRDSQDCELQEEWDATAEPLSPDAVRQFQEIDRAHGEASSLRNTLIETSRLVLLGDSK